MGLNPSWCVAPLFKSYLNKYNHDTIFSPICTLSESKKVAAVDTEGGQRREVSFIYICTCNSIYWWTEKHGQLECFLSVTSDVPLKFNLETTSNKKMRRWFRVFLAHLLCKYLVLKKTPKNQKKKTRQVTKMYKTLHTYVNRLMPYHTNNNHTNVILLFKSAF